MRPTLLQFGDLYLPSYFTLLMVGFSVAIYLTWRDAKRAGVDPDDLLDLSLWMLVGGLVGARILHVFADGYFWDYVHLCTDPLQVRVPSFIHATCQLDADCVAQGTGALCHPETGRCHPAGDCFAALKLWQGGLAFYGGFVLSIGLAVWFIARRKMGFLRTADLCSWGVALGLVFGRTGCFLGGCCFGTATEAPVGVEFPGHVIAAQRDGSCRWHDGQLLKHYDLIEVDGRKVCAAGSPAMLRQAKLGLLAPGTRHALAVHPTQLYEAAFSLAIFLYLYFWRRKRRRFLGQLFWQFCLLYAAGRFLVEYWRDDDRGLWLGGLFSTSQLIALPILLGAAFALYRARRAPPAPSGSG